MPLCSVLPAVVAVALAKRSNKNIFIGNLGGRRSCHGYMYSPAGWLLPYRHTLSVEHNSSHSCDPNQGTDMDRSLLKNDILSNVCFLETVARCPFQCTARCSGKAACLVLRAICAKCAWEAPRRLRPDAALTTTMSCTMATWELYGMCAQ